MTTCPSEVLFQGHTNRRGQFSAPRPFAKQRLEATVDGYGTGMLGNATLAPGKVLELEMPPDADEGFWLKIIDGDGNYLQDLLAVANKALLGVPLLANLFHPDRWLLWLGVFFVLSVYFFPLGIVGRLWRK